jgi:hypothetical protein
VIASSGVTPRCPIAREEGVGAVQVPMRVQQHVDHLPVLVNGAV